MICPNCQNENPETNLFCGMCGTRLAAAPEGESHATDTPESGARSSGPSVRRPFIVSTTAMTDVTAQMLNTRASIPAPSLGTSHLRYATPLKTQAVYRGENVAEPVAAPVDPQDEPMFSEPAAEREERAETRWMEHEAETHKGHMPHYSAPVSGSILGLSTPIDEEVEKPVRTVEEEPREEVVEEEAREGEAPLDRNSFLYIEDSSAQPPHGDVSGPSFLGLGGDDYVAYEEPRSGHGRAYLLLFVLVVVGVLGALEWRASQNGQSVNPMDVLHLKLPAKKGQGPVEVVPPSSTTPSPSATDNNSGQSAGATTTPGGNGKPDLIAEPNQPAQQNQPKEQNLPAQQNAQQEEPAQPAASNNSPNGTQAEANPPTDAEGQPAASPKKSAEETPAVAKPEKPVEVAKSAPPKPTPEKPTATKPAPVTPKPEAPAVDASLNGGNFELQKGVAAGPTEMGRMWLWKAVAKGNGEAPVLLAEMYAQGKGVPKDCEQAMLLLNAAAKKANPHARSTLGSMYANGECVARDRVKAYQWMSAALEANPGSDWIEKNRQALLREMTPAERQRAAR